MLAPCSWTCKAYGTTILWPQNLPSLFSNSSDKKRSYIFRIQTCTFKSEIVKYLSQFRNSINWLLFCFWVFFCRIRFNSFCVHTHTNTLPPSCQKASDCPICIWILKSFVNHKDVCCRHYDFIITIINKYKATQPLLFKPKLKDYGTLKMVRRILMA